MAVTIKQVASGRDMRRFIMLPFSIYRNDSLWIPPLIYQEKSQFDPKSNPAYRYCDTAFFLAEDDGRPVGRVAAIVNRRYVEKTGRKCGRFGWFECEKDDGTADLLLNAAEQWLLSRGMTEVSGPMGFTDNDMTGFLIEGYQELPTIAGSYNPPWYIDMITRRGYGKEVDYVEFKITVPEELPEKVSRMADLISKRTRIRIFNETSTRKLSKRWGHQVFDVLNEAYKDLYGTTLLDEAEINYYIKTYLGQVDPEFIKLAADGDRIVGFIIAMPNLSRAFQKARGHLFPFGFIHLLREMKTSKVLDFYLAGIRPEYRGKGIDALLAYDIAKSALARGMEFAESNHELEENKKIQAMWKMYDKRLHRRIRVFNRPLT